MKKSNLKYYLAASTAFITFIIYLPALRNDFVNWDDLSYILDNTHIRSFDMALFRWAFFDFHASNWHPLTWISHAVDYVFWGLNPLGHHLTNITIHAVNTFLVVFLIIRLLETWKEQKGHKEQSSYLDRRTILIAAVVTGLLFGTHPLHVESVAWIAERKDLLCALFFLLCIISYMTFVASRKHATYLFSLGFLVLALLSKQMAVSLPVILLLLDWYPFERIRSLKTFQSAFIEKLPFIAVSLGSSILSIFAQKAGGGLNNPMAYAELSTRVLVGIKSLIIYLWKMIWPFELIPFYPYPKDASFFSSDYLVPLALASVISIICLFIAKRWKLWLAVWCYYVISLMPVLGIVQVGLQSMADRYTYLPSLGPFLVIGLIAAWIWATIQKLEKWRVLARVLSFAVSIFMVFSLSYLTFKQVGIWKNSMILWSYVIEKNSGKVSFAYYNRGTVFDEMKIYDKAISDYDTAIALDPFYSPAYTNIGVIYFKLGVFSKAIEYFNKSISVNPNEPIAYLDRGISYSYINQYKRAVEDFNIAIALNPDFAYAYLNRGKIFLKTDNKALALADFQKACNLKNKEGCTAMDALIRGNTR